jgi:hypothetical protein
MVVCGPERWEAERVALDKLLARSRLLCAQTARRYGLPMNDGLRRLRLRADTCIESSGRAIAYSQTRVAATFSVLRSSRWQSH